MSPLRRRRPRSDVPEVPGYRLEAPVGFGAGGALWCARDPGGRAVALSFLPVPTGERGTATLRRLGALRSAAHPHLAAVLDVVSTGEERCALVSELVEGPTLATVHAARGDLTARAATTLLAALASALAHLHDRGVVHGDVAPTNVVLTAGGVPVLVDLAGEVSHERGTPGFVAPERRQGAPASAAADVWALARVVAWAAGDDGEDGVLTAALAPDPGERPSARELAVAAASRRSEPIALPSGADLAQARLRSGQEPTQVAAVRRPRGRHRRTRRVPRAASTILLVAGVMAGAGLAYAVAGGPVTASAELGTSEATAVVRELVGARDAALRRGEGAALTDLTVPGSSAARADARLMERLGAAGVRAAGLTTVVEDVRVVAGAAGSAAVVEVVTRQEPYRFVAVDAADPVDGHDAGGPGATGGPAGRIDVVGRKVAGRRQAAGQEAPTGHEVVAEEVAGLEGRCVRMVLEGPRPWRLRETAPCEAVSR